MQIAIGCPVLHRAWILERWFDHVEVACEQADVQPIYVFVGDVRDGSFEVIDRRAEDRVTWSVPATKSSDSRDWGKAGRYEQMVELRNLLLGIVRPLDVEGFLSLDSDILLHPDHLRLLIEDVGQGWAAVGGKCYMTPSGTKCPSWAQLSRDGSLLRADSRGIHPVEIIMACKYMTPAAFGVDYEYHLHGEDVGWSLACARAGLKFAWEGRVASKHVMERHMLNMIDRRIGF